MITYLIIMAIATALVYLSFKVEEKTDNKLLIFLSKAVAILFPAIIAGIRYDVGTDYKGVYEPLFEEILSGETVQRARTFEIGYVLLKRLVIWLGGNFSVLMFLASLLTITPIYIGLSHYKKKICVPLAFFLFMLLFYQKSFNLVRQMMAVAFVFLGFIYLDFKDDDKKYIAIQCLKYFACVIVAGLFQRTSFVMLIIPFIREIYANPRFKVLSIASYVVLLAVILNFKAIGEFLTQFDSFKYYANYFIGIGKPDISIAYYIRVIPVIIPFFFVRKKITEDRQMNFLYSMTVIGCIFLLLGYLTSTYGERISYYFSIFQIVMFPYYIRCLKDNKFLYIASTILIILFNMAMWFYDYIYMKRDETIPYKTIFSAETEQNDNTKEGNTISEPEKPDINETKSEELLNTMEYNI